MAAIFIHVINLLNNEDECEKNDKNSEISVMSTSVYINAI